PSWTRNSPPKPPGAERTSGRTVDRTSAASLSLARAATSRSTPASRYVRPRPRSLARSDTRRLQQRVFEGGHLAERTDALLDLRQPEIDEALHAEPLHGERPHDRAVHHRPP